ncbi:MAG: MFS transporter [Candidatus Helarchaeota archaeon]|nr:MFS transporter [Candidatus Helarchaeota archaeon]
MSLASGIFAIILPWIVDAETSWNLNENALGSLMGVSAILFAVAGLFSAYYVDKMHKKSVIIIGSIFTGINCILVGYSWSYEIFVLAIISIGIGNGIIGPAIFTFIADITPAENRSTNYGLIAFAGLFGVIIGFIIFLGFILVGEWRTPYIITGGITILLTSLLLTVKLPKTGGKESALKQVLEEKDVEYDYRINFKGLKNVFRRKSNQILVLNFSDAFPKGVYLFASLWLTVGHGVSVEIAVLPMLLLSVAIYTSPLFWGKIADILYKKTQNAVIRIKLGIVLMLAAKPLFVMAIIIPWDASGITSLGVLFTDPSFLMFFVLLTTVFFIASGTGPIWSSVVTEINLPEHRATSSQIARFIDQLGVALGAIIAGYLIVLYAPNGYDVAFLLSAFVGLINVGTWILVLRYFKDDKKFVDNILLERAEELKKRSKIKNDKGDDLIEY